MFGTTGEVEKVLVQSIVWSPVNLTTALSSAFALNAVDKLALSVGCQAISEKLTVFQWFNCNNQFVQSYMYISQTSNSSVSAVLDAVPVYELPVGL